MKYHYEMFADVATADSPTEPMIGMNLWASLQRAARRSPRCSITRDNKFTGKIVKVTIDVKPSELSPAHKRAVERGRDEAEVSSD